MGTTFINACDDTSQIDISTKNVLFLENRFTALSIFQRGGLQTFKVREKNTNKLFALKIMPSMNTSNIHKILKDLTLISKKLECIGLAKNYEIHVEESSDAMQIYYIDEYIKGGTLKSIREKLTKQKFRLEKISGIDIKLEFMRIAINLIDTINYLHANNIFHGSIKLENVILNEKNSVPHIILSDLKHHKQIYNINQMHFGKPQPNSNYLPPELCEKDYILEQDIKKLQKGDVWSLGILLLECWIFLFPSEEITQLNSIDLRCMLQTERISFIKAIVKDEAICVLIIKMLLNFKDRLTSKDIINEPIIKLYKYLLYDDEKYLSEVANNSNSCLPYISGMLLTNRSRAVICLLGLMNLYKTEPNIVLQEIERTNSYIHMIEILTICLKDQDTDFINLHENAILVLARILNRPMNCENKCKCVIGGLATLLITILEKDNLKYFLVYYKIYNYSPGVVFDLIASCSHYTTSTLIQLSEKCHIMRKIISYIKNQTSVKEKSLHLLSIIGPFLSYQEIINIKQYVPISAFLDILRRLPMNKRKFNSASNFLKLILNLVNNLQTQKHQEISISPMISDLYEKIATTIISLLCHKETLITHQIHSMCISNIVSINGYNKIPYDCGLLCLTCQENSGISKPFAICIICAHRCHQGHNLMPMGYCPEFQCNCSETKMCSANSSLPLPMHIKYIPKKCEAEYDEPVNYRHDPMVLKQETSKGIFSYISKECITTGTLIGIKPLTTIFLEFQEESDYSSTVAYFEVEVILGGTYDQIAVGLTTDSEYPLDEFAGYKEISIAFHGDDGKCYINGQSITYGCKYGSYDIIGCGVTQNGDVYFTYNGLLLPLINLNLTGNIYPVVSLRGKFTSVRINNGPDFEFEHMRFLEIPVPTAPGIIQPNIDLLQNIYYESASIRDKFIELSLSKGLKIETAAQLKSFMMLAETEKRILKGIYHKQQNSLFSTKISNNEEVKGESISHFTHDLQNTSNIPMLSSITERDPKHEKSSNKHCIIESEISDYTINEMKPLENAPTSDRPIQRQGTGTMRPAGERIGDLPPNNSKRAEKKAEGGQCSCSAGGSTCNIF